MPSARTKAAVLFPVMTSCSTARAPGRDSGGRNGRKTVTLRPGARSLPSPRPSTTAPFAHCADCAAGAALGDMGIVDARWVVQSAGSLDPDPHDSWLVNTHPVRRDSDDNPGQSDPTCGPRSIPTFGPLSPTFLALRDRIVRWATSRFGGPDRKAMQRLSRRRGHPTTVLMNAIGWHRQ